MFTAYTYLADILERLAGFDGTLVGWCLMGFGAVGLIGNSLGGRAVDRHPLGASVLFCAFMIAGMVSLVPNIHSTVGLAVAMGNALQGSALSTPERAVLVQSLQRRTSHPDPLVQEHVHWALQFSALSPNPSNALP